MTLISTVTVGAGGAANIEFTGIAGSASDLFLELSLRGTTTNIYPVISFNSDFGANYSFRRLQGDGSTAASYSNTGFDGVRHYQNSSDSTASTFSNVSIYVPNYTGSTAKSVSIDAVTENNATAANQMIIAGLWSGTAAITAIRLTPASGSFAQYSMASLYTITKGNGGAVVS
jgi:hypothetical protein